MKEKVILVLLAVVLVTSLVGFGACAALPEKAVPTEVRMAPPIGDLGASPESPGSARLTFTSTFTGADGVSSSLADTAKSGTYYDFRCSTKPITKSNCMDTPPVPLTSQGAASPSRDVWVGTYGGVSIIAPSEGEGVTVIINGLNAGTTYYFAAWIFTKPLESFDYKKVDGNYKFTSVDIPDKYYLESMSNIASCTTPKSAPSISVDKMVSADGGVTWHEEVEQNVGQNVQFRITIANDGDVPLGNIFVSDALSGYLEYVQGTASPTPDSTAPYIIWNFSGPVQPGDAMEIAFSTHVASDGEHTNCVKVQAECDGEIVNDQDCAVVIGLAEEEAVIEVAFRNVEAQPSVILELKKGDDVVLQVMETILVEPTLTFYTAIWTPDLGQYYWYGYAEWNKEQPQYTFGFATDGDKSRHDAAMPAIRNIRACVTVSPDGDNIEWNDKEAYLGLMEKLCEAMEEIGSHHEVAHILQQEVPGSIFESISEVELQLLDDIGDSDYEKAISGLAARLPYQGTEVRNPGDVTYDELERVVRAIEASVIVMGTAADLACPNPLAGVCFATGNKGGFAIGGFNAA